MARTALLATFLAALVIALPLSASAQTKEDTIVYALQSDIDNWDPPNSVLREAIILGYHVFDHLAARDVKTGKVGPSLATSGEPSTTRRGRSSFARASSSTTARRSRPRTSRPPSSASSTPRRR
jgi:ABC-type transport system substrate-binding protein